MKYLAIGLLFSLFTLNISAQKTAGVSAYPAIISDSYTEKAIPDTFFHNFFNLTPVLYTAPVGGWMNGTNGYFDVEKGQETKVLQTYYLTGLIYWFALKDKNTGGDTSSVIFKLYKKDSVRSVNGVTRLVPGTLQAADTVKLGDLNANVSFAAGLNYFALPTPIVNNMNYVSAFSMELMNPKDTVALYGTTDSLVDVTDYSWEKWNGVWNTIKNAWTLDIDFAVFPVVDLEGASVEEQALAELKISPNPATDFIRVNFNNAVYDSYVIINSVGQTVKSGTINSDQIEISITDFATGYYMIGAYSGTGKDAHFYRFLKR
jgi:Secretion system C-terminal sorting domain